MLEIINTPHPALRHVSQPLRRVDKKLKQIVREMFDLMYEHRGVGLAANQVNLPFRLFVINETGTADEGEEMVLVNPVLRSPRGRAEDEEGCLSIPGVYGNVLRPAQVRLEAWDLAGNRIDQVVSGRLARIIQHEFDHLQGVLFPDRMSESARKAIAEDLDAFDREFRRLQEHDERLQAESVARRLAELEAEYCATG